jgi:hypothetical protein
MYTLHCTQKLLVRVKRPVIADAPPPTTVLGNWYATALMWKPQVALLVNETTRLPVFMPLAPAADLAARFPVHLAQVLRGHDVDPDFIAQEIAAMTEVGIAKTASRSVLGTINDFTWIAEGGDAYHADELYHLSMRLAKTPIGGQMKYASPESMLEAAVERWAEAAGR